RGMRLHGNAEGVFLFVVRETAPRSGVLGEDDGPLVFVGNHVQAVVPGGEGLAFDGDVVGECDSGVFVCTGAPYPAVRDGLAEDFAAVNHGHMIRYGDIREADALRGRGTLADTRNAELRRL